MSIISKSIFIGYLLILILALTVFILAYFCPKLLYYKIITPIRNILNVRVPDDSYRRPGKREQRRILYFMFLIISFIVFALLSWWKHDPGFRSFFGN